MKNFFTAFCVTATIVFSIIAVFFSTQKETNISTDNMTKHTVQYKISDHSGKLAVFKNNSDIPIKIYNIYLENLPATDRKEIIKGITCEDDAELQRLIEDYTS